MSKPSETPAIAAPAEDAEAAKKKAAEEKAKKKADAKAEKDKAREKAKADKVAAKEKAKADKDAAKTASKQPSQNGITRPKPETVTGKAWEVFDSISQKSGAPATIGEALKAASTINEATVRTQYARWRKFHGISGRTEAKPAETQAASA